MNALSVGFPGHTISSKRYILGVSVSQKTASYSDVLSVQAKDDMKSSSGGRHRIEYKIVARLSGGQITLAEHIDSSSRKELVVDYFEKEFMGSDRVPGFEI